MRLFVLISTARAELAADEWWDTLSDAERDAYLEAHPGSKYRKGRKKAGGTREIPLHERARRAGILHDRMQKFSKHHADQHIKTGDVRQAKLARDYGAAADHFTKSKQYYESGDHEAGSQAHIEAQRNRAMGNSFARKNGIEAPDLGKAPSVLQEGKTPSADAAWKAYVRHMSVHKAASDLKFNSGSIRKIVSQHPDYAQVQREMKQIRKTGDTSAASHPDVLEYVKQNPDKDWHTGLLGKKSLDQYKDAIRSQNKRVATDEDIEDIVRSIIRGESSGGVATRLNLKPSTVSRYGALKLGKERYAQIVKNNKTKRMGGSQTTTKIHRPGVMDNTKVRGPSHRTSPSRRRWDWNK